MLSILAGHALRDKHGTVFQDDLERKPGGPSFALRALAVLLVLLVGLGPVLFSLYQNSRHAAEYRVWLQERITLERAATAVSGEVEEVVADLRFLIDRTEAMVRGQSAGQGASLGPQGSALAPDTMQHLGATFLAMARQKRWYDQLRFIDAAGQERIRVNFNAGRPALVPEAGLQNKRHRYYFEDSIALKAGQVFVSPMDLNIEHGVIETPHKPMIRIGAPVFAPDGRKLGVILLNVLASRLIETFRQAVTDTDGRAMLLNAEGYWLAAPEPDLAWGFMFEDGPSFAARHPTAWDQIRTRLERGLGAEQMTVDRGLLTYRIVTPLAEPQSQESDLVSSDGSPLADGPSNRRFEGDDYHWIMVSWLPPALLATELQDVDGRWRLIAVLASTGACLAALIVGALLASRASYRRLADRVAERHRIVLETAGEGVFGLDPGGRIRFLNPAAERLTGRTAAQLLGMSFHELLLPRPSPASQPHRRNGPGPGLGAPVPKDGKSDANAPRETCPVCRALGGQTPAIASDEHLIRVGANPVPVRAITTVIRDPAGQPAGAVVSLMDLTEREQYEKALLAARAEAIAANEAKSRFLAMMSHELRTPLNAILGFAQVLEGETDEARRRANLYIIRRAGESLLGLVNDILEYTRVEHGQPDSVPRPFHLRQELEEVASIVAGLVASPAVTLTWTVDTTVPDRLLGDARSLERVLLNLVGNALKFTDSGRVSVTVQRLPPEPADGVETAETEARRPSVRLAFCVADTGPGIRPEDQARIFRCFEQGEDILVRRHSGAGLGLAISQKLVQQMGGEIRVESELGQGSRFTVVLAFAPADAEA